jgi:hypothetical protein
MARRNTIAEAIILPSSNDILSAAGRQFKITSFVKYPLLFVDCNKNEKECR